MRFTFRGIENKHPVSRRCFDEVIIPSLKCFLFVPLPETKGFDGKPLGDSYFDLSSWVYRDRADAKDRLMGFCADYAVMEVIQELCRTYARLVNATNKGSEFAEFVSNKRQCGQCNAILGNRVEVCYLIEKFKRGRPEFPHEVYLEDSADWCTGPFLRFDLPSRRGDDPDLHKWLQDKLR